jgi:hypothetical protein
MEAQSRGLNPRDNCVELMEVGELRRRLKEAEVECIAEAGRLIILVRDVSKVLVDIDMPPIPEIPWDPHTTDEPWRQWAPPWNNCKKPTPQATVP